MKKSILLFAFSLVAMTSYAASTIIASPAVAVSVVNDGDKKVEIEVAKLPASIAASLNETHKGATISKAYQNEAADGKVTGYEVVVKSGDKEETVKFDAAGALVK